MSKSENTKEKDAVASAVDAIVMYLKKLFGIYKPKITLEYGNDDKENQIQEIHCHKDGEFSHTVRMHYFTREQFEQLEKARDEIYRNYGT